MSVAPAFRRFVELLDEAGELVRVGEEVDWRYEVGERTRAEAAGANRALLFERIRGYEGERILTNGVGSASRMGIALGLAPGASFREVGRVARSRVAQPIPPERVAAEDGRVVQAGDGVDLERLPVPWWSRVDVGRYLGTWHLNITRDPETGDRNVGAYRMQLVDGRTALVSASAGSHLAAQVRRAEARGEPLEMAVAIGVPETLVLAAGMAVSPDTDELALGGALAGEPVRVRLCESVDLEVPVDAEIVVEGRLRPGERASEGPFVDYAGDASTNPRGLILDVSLVSRRPDAIFRGAATGQAGAEDHLAYAVAAAAGCLDFHGSRARHHLQSVCMRFGWYHAFQVLGRAHPPAALKQLRRRGQG